MPIVLLGDLVVAISDEVTRQCPGSVDVPRLTARILEHMLQNARMPLEPIDGRMASTMSIYPRIPALS